MADDYAAAAFKCAANASRLVELASSIESSGGRVDGFAVSVSDDVNASDFSQYAKAFSTLASTGKLVKIVDLSPWHKERESSSIKCLTPTRPLVCGTDPLTASIPTPPLRMV